VKNAKIVQLLSLT